jgi:hypothetical protein
MVTTDREKGVVICMTKIGKAVKSRASNQMPCFARPQFPVFFLHQASDKKITVNLENL